jgi:hypothetical protein
MGTIRLVVVALVALLTLGCSDNDGPAPIPTTPSPVTSSSVADIVEFRVIGDVTPTTITWSDSLDGTTFVPSASLPYFVEVKSSDPNLFVLLQAQANSVLTFGTLQVQIVINGRVFRDDFTSGYGPLMAAVSGTWRR